MYHYFFEIIDINDGKRDFFTFWIFALLIKYRGFVLQNNVIRKALSHQLSNHLKNCVYIIIAVKKRVSNWRNN